MMASIFRTGNATSGTVKANNPDGAEFEEERLAKVLQEHRDRSPVQIVEAVTRAVSEFSAGGPVADDLTLVVAKRT